MRPRYLVWLTFGGFAPLLALFAHSLSAAEPSSLTGEITVRVIDAGGAPQGGAAVSFSFFDNINRLYNEMSPELRSDESGLARIKRLAAENDFYLIRARTKDGLVGYRTVLLNGKDAREKVDITVLPPQATTIHVQDESGKPIAGATIWSLTHRGVNVDVQLKGIDLERALGFSRSQSSEAGDLPLPELPEGQLDIKLFHPDFVPVRVKELAVKNGARRDAVMKRGVKVSLHIETDGKKKPPAGLMVDLNNYDYYAPSTLDGPLPEAGPDGTIQLTVAAGKYSSLRLTHPDYVVTPQYYANFGHGPADDYEYLKIEPDANSFNFQLHRKVRVHGRVRREDGQPLANDFVFGELRSPSEDGPFARFALKWSQAGFADTNDRGEFDIELAAGQVSVQTAEGGFILPTRYQFEVAADGSTVAPDVVVKAMPKLRGIVKDQSGKGVAGAVVRFRNSMLCAAAPMVVTDAAGRFELSPPFIPVDWKTEAPQPLNTVIAFHPYEPLAAESRVDLGSSSAPGDIVLQMKPQDYRSLITGYPADLSPWDRGEMPADKKDHLAAMSLVGKRAPELDGAAWLNTDKAKMSLADFRGKFILLQFWTTWCGPCHDDMPSVKLANQLYKEKGLVVIGVHDNSMPLEDIKKDAAKNGLTYPIVVDHPDGRLLAAYSGHGFYGYPSYILIGPDGRIVKDDETIASPSLREFKIELIREHLMAPTAGIGAALRIENGKLFVKSIVPDSVAARSNALKPNDQIIAIAEERGELVSVAGLELAKAVGLVRGRNGTIVRLTVIPAGKDELEARVVSLTRGPVTTSFGGLGDRKLLSRGMMAPNFRFTRLADDKEDELDGHRGKVVVLLAWASWCKPCIEHMAKVEAIEADHPEWKDRVEILPVSIDEKREDAVDCWKAHHWSKLPVAWSGPAICGAYHINALPAIVVIDKNGKVVAVDSPLNTLSDVIKQNHLLDGEGESHSPSKP